jgi:hypothetical protein
LIILYFKKFFLNSKKIKDIFKNLIENLSNINNKAYNLINQIFISQTKTFSDIQIDLLEVNNIIIDKIIIKS